MQAGDQPYLGKGCRAKTLAEHGATIRMGAFATTLDPLPGEEHNGPCSDLLAGTVVQPPGFPE